MPGGSLYLRLGFRRCLGGLDARAFLARGMFGFLGFPRAALRLGPPRLGPDTGGLALAFLARGALGLGGLVGRRPAPAVFRFGQPPGLLGPRRLIGLLPSRLSRASASAALRWSSSSSFERARYQLLTSELKRIREISIPCRRVSFFKLFRKVLALGTCAPSTRTGNDADNALERRLDLDAHKVVGVVD